jgi:hypothetical protein
VLRRFGVACLVGVLAAWSWNTWSNPDVLVSRAQVLSNAIPRLQPLVDADAAYARADLSTAISLYEQVAATPPADQESPPASEAITGLARFRALVALTALGDDDLARAELQALSTADPNAPLARLAAQFWDQYGMTGSARAACAQLATAVDSQAHPVLDALADVGIWLQPDELCFVP